MARQQESNGQHLYLYAGNGEGGFADPQHLSNGWGRYNTIVGMPSSTSTSGRRLPSDLSLSPQGASFIAEFEGFRATPYNDPGNNCTIGYGHLIHKGACTDADRRAITPVEGIALLKRDAARLSSELKPYISATPLYQHEWDAIVSWAYNFGPAEFPGTGLDRALSASPPNYAAVPGN